VVGIRVCIFGDAARVNFHLAALVGKIFDLAAELCPNIFHFATEFGTHDCDLVKGFDIDFGDFFCQFFKRFIHATFNFIWKIIGGSDRVLAFRDFLTYFSIAS